MATKVSERYKRWQKKESNSVQEKSGAGFDTKLTLNAKPVVGGKYRIMFNGEARVKPGGGLTSQPKFRIKIDGTTTALRTFPASTEWAGVCAWDIKQFSEDATPTVIVEVQRFEGSETIEVQRLKVSIELMEGE